MGNSILVVGRAAGGSINSNNANFRSSKGFDPTKTKCTKSYTLLLILPGIIDIHASDILNVTVDTDTTKAIIASALMQNKGMLFSAKDRSNIWNSAKVWCMLMDYWRTTITTFFWLYQARILRMTTHEQ